MNKTIRAGLMYDADKEFPYINIFNHGEYTTPIGILTKLEAKDLMNDLSQCLNRIKENEK